MKPLLVCVALMASMGGLGATERAAFGAEKKSPVNAAPQETARLVAAPMDTANPADFVGAETCSTCHADLATKFSTNPHSRLAMMHNGKGVTCEGCHGPGKAHVEGGGDITKIFRFEQASPKEVDEKCLSCHAGAHPNFERSPHGEAGVSCAGCHSVHKSESADGMLKVAQPKLCYSCHTDVKPAFAQPFHHKVDEGLMKCSDCHDTHGSFQNNQLRSTADQNSVCVKCHTDTAGPFVFEHPVVKTEGCSSCHMPHGSPNARLLNVAYVNTLCLQCHSSTNLGRFPNAVSETGGPVHTQTAQYVPCTNCHTQIHGSNAAFNFFR